MDQKAEGELLGFGLVLVLVVIVMIFATMFAAAFSVPAHHSTQNSFYVIPSQTPVQSACNHISEPNGSILLVCDQPNVTVVYQNQIYHSNTNQLLMTYMMYSMLFSNMGGSNTYIYNDGRYLGTANENTVMEPEEQMEQPAEQSVDQPSNDNLADQPSNDNLADQPSDSGVGESEGMGDSEGDSGGFGGDVGDGGDD
jgi:hypothetical protein